MSSSPDLKKMAVDQLNTLLEWMDGSPQYREFCDSVRDEVKRKALVETHCGVMLTSMEIDPVFDAPAQEAMTGWDVVRGTGRERAN